MLANGGWDLTLILLAWTIWRAPTNASKWRMGFNSAFKGSNRFKLKEQMQKVEIKVKVKLFARRSEVYMNPFLLYVLDAVEWLLFRPCHFTPEKNKLNERQIVVWSHSGKF